MKKTHILYFNKINSKLISCVFFIFIFLFSCGIDYYIYLYPIVDVSVCESYELENPDPTNNLFKFKTRDNANSSTSYFKGFQIYYRIYNSVTQMQSDRSYINSYNTNTDYQANIISYLENKNFKPLSLKDKSVSPPVIVASPSSTDRSIQIRLGIKDTDGLFIDGVSDGIPVRSVSTPSNLRTFFDTDNFYETDEDIYFSSSEAPGGIGDVDTWYVYAYVLTYGVDDMYSPVYSIACELGGLVIGVLSI